MYVHLSECDLNYPVAVGEILSLVAPFFFPFFSSLLSNIYKVIKFYRCCRRENKSDPGQEKMVNYFLISLSNLSGSFQWFYA